jgi:hypothetical protein
LKETAGPSKEETVKAVETAQAERTEVGNSGPYCPGERSASGVRQAVGKVNLLGWERRRGKNPQGGKRRSENGDRNPGLGAARNEGRDPRRRGQGQERRKNGKATFRQASERKTSRFRPEGQRTRTERRSQTSGYACSSNAEGRHNVTEGRELGERVLAQAKARQTGANASIGRPRANLFVSSKLRTGPRGLFAT